MNDKLKAHLALLGANVFYGAGFTVAKAVMPRLIEPLGFIFIRVTVVMLLFWFSFFGGDKFRAKIAKKDWGILVLGGLFGVALNQMLFFLGLNLTFPDSRLAYHDEHAVAYYRHIHLHSQRAYRLG